MNIRKMRSLSQNPVGAKLRFDGRACGGGGLKPAFSAKSGVPFPRTGVLGKTLGTGFITAVLVFFGPHLPAQSNFVRGEELLMQNRPGEALVFLENAIAEDPGHVKAFLYLGIVYLQLDRLDEAAAAYRKILPRAGGETARVACNLGDVYYRKGDMTSAEQYYTLAVGADSTFASAWLNRANTRVKTGSLKESLADYEQYLILEPRSPKRPGIEKLTALIREEFAAAERRKLLEEEAARAEAERRQRLLDEVSASLQSAAEDSKGLSAGSEEVMGYEGEFELE
ncbi:MAG: tetratricopeptide repeat protein [Treponema sp.]|jgi:tetratricopeptide (TPR) repeat protein|nr:tetratricopeptide repeat protein [Treponema sp.]